MAFLRNDPILKFTLTSIHPADAKNSAKTIWPPLSKTVAISPKGPKMLSVEEAKEIWKRDRMR